MFGGFKWLCVFAFLMQFLMKMMMMTVDGWICGYDGGGENGFCGGWSLWLVVLLLFLFPIPCSSFDVFSWAFALLRLASSTCCVISALRLFRIFDSR